ncbi:Hypothetical protein RAK1035_0936 [Roseovarius sp. AK1035]|nr:Hypothetical protein RAK1035_0936 [Roseovarius sp. AK1035]
MERRPGSYHPAASCAIKLHVKREQATVVTAACANFVKLL